VKEMTKLEKRKLIAYIVGIVLLLIVIIGGGFLLFNKDKKDPITDNDPVQNVTPDQAEEMYSELTTNCTGAMVWDLKLGDKVEIQDLSQNTNACKTNDHYSKMVGYYEIDNGVVIHVNVLKKQDDKLYKLDGTLVGVYEEASLDTLLDGGTTYSYTYMKDHDKYKLTQVELMDQTIPEETQEGNE